MLDLAPGETHFLISFSCSSAIAGIVQLDMAAAAASSHVPLRGSPLAGRNHLLL